MACLAYYKFPRTKIPLHHRLFTSKPYKPKYRPSRLTDPPRPPYEIPKRYKDSFYLSNAAFYDSVNWFLHKAYETVFPAMKNKLQELLADRALTSDEIGEKAENIVAVLDQCNSIIDVRFPLKKDDGSYEVVRGFRAHSGLNTGYMSCLGGLRIDGNITRDHMKALAVLSTYKNACMGINMGGAHGGLKIRPKEYSPNELQNIIRMYTTELIRKGYCNDRDVFHPDINTSEQEMSWISKAYLEYTGQPLCPATVGKPIEYGGFENYDKAAAYGAFFALNFFLNNEQMMVKVELTKGLKGKTFIIQGLGKLGAQLAELLVNNGAICVGVKEHNGYIYESKGLDLKDLYEYRAKNGTLINYGMYKNLLNDEVYVKDCDILIFASYQKSLMCCIAKDVKAKVVLEAADGPVSPSSHAILTGQSKLIIPDIYACAGATIASYLEYLRSMQQSRVCNEDLLRFSHNIYGNILNRITDKEGQVAMSGSSCQIISNVNVPNVLIDSIECILTDVGNDILKHVDLYKLETDVRTAAYMVAIRNTFNAIFYQKKFL